MENVSPEIIERIRELKKQNDCFFNSVSNLTDTEENRTDVMTSIFIRKNRELRLNNLWEIENNYRTQGRIFGQSPEKYVIEQESTQRAYIEQINRFMKEYNTAYTNIQIEQKKAEQAQKVLMFKSCKFNNSKKIYMLSNNYKNFKAKRQMLINEYEKTNDFELYKKIESFEDPCEQYEKRIQSYKNKIKLYENILLRCDKEFEECSKRRERDFKELFGEEIGLALKKTDYKSILNMIMNKLDGKNRFSRLVIKKYAKNINEIKTKKLEIYADRIKKESVLFSEEIENMMKSSGV